MKNMLIALAALAIPAAAEAQTRGTISVTIGNHQPYYHQNDGRYLYCRRPNGRVGIVTDVYGRPISRYHTRYRYNYTLKCSKLPRYIRRYDHYGY